MTSHDEEPVLQSACRPALHLLPVGPATAETTLSPKSFPYRACDLLRGGAATKNVVTAMRATPAFAPAILPLALLLTVVMTPSHSAPASSDELAGSGETRNSSAEVLQGSTSPAVPVVPSVPQSKTVELLLQLQDQPHALSGEGKPTSDSARRRLSSSAAAASGQPTSAEDATPLRAALQATVLRDASPRNGESNSEVGAPHRDGMFERSGSAGSGVGTQTRREPTESLLANPVIRYIRENREMVVGVSLAVLAAIWLTANFSWRRSR